MKLDYRKGKKERNSERKKVITAIKGKEPHVVAVVVVSVVVVVVYSNCLYTQHTVYEILDP